jgi:hypothetical protein
MTLIKVKAIVTGPQITWVINNGSYIEGKVSQTLMTSRGLASDNTYLTT